LHSELVAGADREHADACFVAGLVGGTALVSGVGACVAGTELALQREVPEALRQYADEADARHLDLALGVFAGQLERALGLAGAECDGLNTPVFVQHTALDLAAEVDTGANTSLGLGQRGDQGEEQNLFLGH